MVTAKLTGSKIIQYGDVLIDTTRNAVVCSKTPKSCLWPSSQDGNVYVPYVIDKIYTEDQTKVIWKSLQEISSLTCVKFYYRRSNEPGYISVQSENGCYSYVGYRPTKRKLSLKVPGCVHFGLVAHEFLHAIGFQHEHSRSDRDEYLKIMWENVPKGREHNFNLLKTNNLGTVYDYGSIMHYGRYAFSKNKNPTMVPIPDPNVEIGQARGLSTKDVIKINKLYSCDICGGMLIAASGNITSPNFPGLYPNNADCKWLIRAPHRLKILLEFLRFQIQEFAACIGDHLTIYDGSSIHADILEGPICGADNPAAISTRNELFITFTSTRKLQATGFAAKYKFITCGYMLKSRSGEIESKSHPSNNVHCFWVLLVKRYYKLTLIFQELKLKESSNCTENSVIIHDVAQSPSVVAEQYCNKVSLPLKTNSTGRAVIIEFQHKPSAKHGFKVSYERIVSK
ncbi:astacin-like metalloendopeptidase [Rhincodon typus]|uniref:astacin-like metalloendopeptidase n=1 Tax=Rhincodon typus TaxID=259920 RepID=UPI00202F2E27|nr:astacin-like metalloendopeptidase [Rhincodon typus]